MRPDAIWSCSNGISSATAVHDKAAQATTDLGATVFYVYDAVTGYAAELSTQAVQKLRKEPDVAYISRIGPSR